MSHFIIIGGVKKYIVHDDDGGRSAGNADSTVEFGDIKFTPSHDLSLADQAKIVTKIQRALDKLGTAAE